MQADTEARRRLYEDNQKKDWNPARLKDSFDKCVTMLNTQLEKEVTEKLAHTLQASPSLSRQGIHPKKRKCKKHICEIHISD